MTDTLAALRNNTIRLADHIAGLQGAVGQLRQQAPTSEDAAGLRYRADNLATAAAELEAVHRTYAALLGMRLPEQRGAL